MCEYCSIESEDRKILKETKTSLGILGEMRTNLELSGYDGEYCIGAYSDFEDIDESACSTIKIKYCPMCGRKFE